MALNYKPNVVKVDFFSYRHMIVGVPKVGKTTMFAELINKLYNGDMSKGLLISVGNEDGYSAIDGMYAAPARTYGDFIDIIDDLCDNKEDNNFEAIAIDTCDELVSITEAEVCRRSKKESGQKCTINGAFGGYGSGRKMACKLIDDALARLKTAGFGVFLISHSKEKTVKEKGNVDEYNKLGIALSNDYAAVFTNKSDIITMIDVGKEIDSNKHVVGMTRTMYFRSSGYYDCGSRFPDIIDSCAFTVDNYIQAVNDAIRASIKSVKADDKYIEKKKAEETKAKEDYYNEHKEELASEDAYEASFEPPDTSAEADEIKSQIKSTLKALPPEDKKTKRAALKEAGLPDSYTKVTDIDVLNKILDVVSK